METAGQLAPWAAAAIAIIAALTPWVMKRLETQAKRDELAAQLKAQQESGEIARLERWLQSLQTRLDTAEVNHRKCELENERMRGELGAAKSRINELEGKVQTLEKNAVP
jgi:DNA repair exonuclease SbcCD ATPase subunit